MRAFTIVFVALLSLLSAGPFSAAQDQQKVPRLPPLPQPLDPTLQEMFDKRRAMGGSVINLIPSNRKASPRVGNVQSRH